MTCWSRFPRRCAGFWPAGCGRLRPELPLNSVKTRAAPCARWATRWPRTLTELGSVQCLGRGARRPHSAPPMWFAWLPNWMVAFSRAPSSRPAPSVRGSAPLAKQNANGAVSHFPRIKPPREPGTNLQSTSLALRGSSAGRTARSIASPLLWRNGRQTPSDIIHFCSPE